jgi:hypothetical protein
MAEVDIAPTLGSELKVRLPPLEETPSSQSG